MLTLATGAKKSSLFLKPAKVKMVATTFPIKHFVSLILSGECPHLLNSSLLVNKAGFLLKSLQGGDVIRLVLSDFLCMARTTVFSDSLTEAKMASYINCKGIIFLKISVAAWGFLVNCSEKRFRSTDSKEVICLLTLLSKGIPKLSPSEEPPLKRSHNRRSIV